MTTDYISNRDAEMPFLAHISELRHRLIGSLIAFVLGFIVGCIFYNDYINTLIRPFGEALYITRIEQGFTTRIKISVYSGLIISFPVHFYNVIAFILPAMTRNERRTLMYFLFGSFLLLVFGGYMAYAQILPLSIQFLKSSSFTPANVTTWLDYRGSLTFVFQLLLAFLVLFQFPLVILLLMKINVLDRRWLFRSSRYFIVVIFILSAIITPPDVVSQLGLAVPLILLFYLTILVAKVFNLGATE